MHEKAKSMVTEELSKASAAAVESIELFYAVYVQGQRVVEFIHEPTPMCKEQMALEWADCEWDLLCLVGDLSKRQSRQPRCSEALSRLLNAQRCGPVTVFGAVHTSAHAASYWLVGRGSLIARITQFKAEWCEERDTQCDLPYMHSPYYTWAVEFATALCEAGTFGIEEGGRLLASIQIEHDGAWINSQALGPGVDQRHSSLGRASSIRLDRNTRVAETDCGRFCLPERQAAVLAALMDKKWQRVSSRELVQYTKNSSEQIGRIIGRMPSCIRACIDSRPGHDGGFQLTCSKAEVV